MVKSSMTSEVRRRARELHDRKRSQASTSPPSASLVLDARYSFR